MKLKYINLLLNNEVKGRMYSSEFSYHTCFISNYFSKEIRKLNFQTNNYNMICIELVSENNVMPSKLIEHLNVVDVYLPFDIENYEQIKGTEDCSFYLELLETGLKKANDFTPIPIEKLTNLINVFKKNGCKNEWIHKKKRFKEEGLELILTCQFYTNFFQLLITINSLSEKKELISGVVMRTMPDEIHFNKMYNDVLIRNDFIIVNDSNNVERVLINLEDAKKGVFNKAFTSYIFREDYTQEQNEKFKEIHNEIIKTLSYDGYSSLHNA